VSGRRVPAAVVVEADGGSRGNPGSAAYGAVLKDAATGEVIAERGERIGVATNNVAEYRGLIAGLEMYAEHTPGAELEVRLDSKLVVEQMSGRWKIKHPDMKPLALRANRLAPPHVRYVWVPRAQNAHADRLANEALDGPEGTVVGSTWGEPLADAPTAPTAPIAPTAPTAPAGHAPVVVEEPDVESPLLPATDPASGTAPAAPESTDTIRPTPPWEQGRPTTFVLIRHGDTDHTAARTFSGRTGTDPGLNEHGRTQVRATAEWLAPLAEEPDLVMLSSPMRRTRESADIVAERLGSAYDTADALVEAGFGTWEGLTYGDVLRQDPHGFTRWLSDPSHPAGGHGDSMQGVSERVREARDLMLLAHASRTVVAVTHLTPIKALVQDVLDLPFEAAFKTEIMPASVTVLTWYPDGRGVVRLLNGLPAPSAYVGPGRVR
jgi:ribonuclease H / adenosylcobalamin/alpha-ribazole phosphatase